jgi:regulator of sigma E protease
VDQTYQISRLTLLSIGKLIKGTVSTKTLGGPIMIAEMAGQQAKAGLTNLIFFIAVLSINLAVLNFLPIPVLDGGHLMFFSSRRSSVAPSTSACARLPSRPGFSF